MKSCKIWIGQCKAARGIKDDFGTDEALAYLIDSKFLKLSRSRRDGRRVPSRGSRFRC